MIHIEKELEIGVRSLIRKALSKAAETVPELANVQIITFWAPPEEGATRVRDGLAVFLVAQPNASQGYNHGVGFEPMRTVSLDVSCITQPDTDADSRVACALYVAVRGVFEAVPFVIELPAKLQFSGMLITGGGAGDIEDMGQVASFGVEMHVCLI